MNVIDFATRRPIGAPAPIAQRFHISEPPRRQLHAADLVELIAVVSFEQGSAVLPLANELRELSAEARRPIALDGRRIESDLPPVFFESEWEDTTGAMVLDVVLTRGCATTLAYALRGAGVPDHTGAMRAAG